MRSNIMHHIYQRIASRPRSILNHRLSAENWLFLSIAALFVLWTAVPLFSNYAVGLDAIEMHSWSLAPQWGYYKHPPLPAWVIALSEFLFGKTKFALVLPSTISIAITYWAIWHLAKKILLPHLAVVATFLSTTCLYYQLWAVSFNHNVIQIPLWAWCITLFYQASHSTRVRDWVALGITFGLALLAKYTAVLLLPPALLFLFLTPNARHNLRLLALLSGALATALVVGPHLAWLVEHDFQAFNYVSARLAEHSGSFSWLKGFASFIGTALAAHSVMLLVLGLRGGFAKQTIATMAKKIDNMCAFNTHRHIVHMPQTYNEPEKKRFLLLFGLGPFLLALLVGFSGKTLSPMWDIAMVPLSGMLLVYWKPIYASRLYQRRWLAFWLIFQLLLASLFLMKDSATYYRFARLSARAAYPAKILVSTVATPWQTKFPEQKLHYVAGHIWEAGIVSFYHPDTPHVLVDGDFSTAPWIKKEQVYHCGMVLLSPTQAMLTSFPTAQIQAPLTIPAVARGLPNKILHWAVIAPQKTGCSDR